MIFTAKQMKKKAGKIRLCAFLMVGSLMLGLFLGAQAAGQTELLLDLRGISYAEQNWLSVPLGGRFDVFTPEGLELGRLCANPSAEQVQAGETDRLTIADGGIDKVLLVPVVEDFQAGFACENALEVPLTPGESQRFTAVAYARQGLFTLRYTLAGSGEPLSGAEFIVLGAAGTEYGPFVTDENGEYTAVRSLPNGEYWLEQTAAPGGISPMRGQEPFTIETYFGHGEEITRIEIEGEPISPWEEELAAEAWEEIPQEAGEEKADDGMQQAVTTGSLAGSAPELEAGSTITAASPGEQLTAVTNAEGGFLFESIPAGDYTVYAPLAEGMRLAEENGWQLSQQGDMIWLSTAVFQGGVTELPMAIYEAAEPVPAEQVPPGEAGLAFDAFNDSNENGMRGEYERPIPGVLIEVLDADGQTVLASGVTDNSGEGALSGVPQGDHVLRVTMPSGYMLTQKGSKSGMGASCVAYSGGSTALSDPVQFVAGETAMVGVAAIPVGSFSGRVWEDLNNNAVMDAEEPGMPGVTLTLTGVKTKTPITIVTDDTGVYQFLDLRNDQYNFSASLPEGAMFARYSLSGGDLRSVFTTAGTEAVRQFPVSGAADVKNKNVGVIRSGRIEGTAFLDVNYNGMLDEDESGYPGVKVEVIRIRDSETMGSATTGEDGLYQVAGLREGEYRVRAILPDNGSLFSLAPAAGAEGFVNRFAGREGRRESSLAPVALENGGKATVAVGVAHGAAIKGTVYLDANYDGVMGGKEKKISGVKVELWDRNGAVVQRATTNNNGNYTLDGVMPGEYTLHFLRKDNHAFTRLRSAEAEGNWVKGLAGDYGVTEPFVVSMGTDIQAMHAGMLPSSTLTGIFFDDLNDNGLQDLEELGMADVKVRLYSEDAEIDLVAEVTPEGTYFFDGVMPGSYTLTYRLPEHVEMAKVVAEGNTLPGQGREITTEPFSIEMGTKNVRPMVGAVTLGTFEGYLFHDVNANGQMEEGEATLAGLVVTLEPNRADLEAATATSGADGRFSITALRPAEYQLKMELPQGYIFSADIKESQLVLGAANGERLACPWSVLTNRALNAVGAVQPARLAGYVFLDENQDGVQGETEALMANLTFELVNEADGRTVKRVAPGADGHVTFVDVRPGTYTVAFAIPAQAEPAGDNTATMVASAGRMVQTGIVVQEAEVYENIHAGLVSRTSIGGVAMLDENGQRHVLEGIRVTLYQGEQTAPLQTVVTNAEGRYRFDGLWPDEYRIETALPEGMIFVRPGDPNYASGASVIAMTSGAVGFSNHFPLRMADHRLEEHILYIRPAKIGDLAWLDVNQNGLLDGGEPRIPGVTVTLLDNGQPVAVTQTDAFGYYLFSDVYPGEYTLEAVAYPELGITKPVPALRLISSCLVQGDGSGARSEPFQALSGVTDVNFDLGFVLLEGQRVPPAILQPSPQKDWTGSYGSNE